MAKQTYTGSCQCGRVRYEADLELITSHETLTALVKSNAFRLLSGAEDLSDFEFGPVLGHNQVCRYCGIRPFGKCHLDKLGGVFYTINLATLDEPLGSGLAEAAR